MTFDRLLTLISDRSEILTEIDELLKLKHTADESAKIPAVPILNDFIATEITNCEIAVKSIAKHHADSTELNALFKQYAIA